MSTTKSYKISKNIVVKAWKLVKANQGSPGIDGQTIEQFESKLKDNLYKLWNRMSSGSYFPPAVKTVGIPKKDGGVRKLGIPCVVDRVAQMIAKLYFEPLVEPYFHEDSYGYRPNKSAHQALAITRRRCWRQNWVLEFDIKGLFDNVSHELLMKAVKKHTDNPWLLLYIKRWLTAPISLEDGTTVQRKCGVPQGGVVSPVLANLFMHYVFDKWMDRNHPNMPFCRYADDGLVHCNSQKQAEQIKELLALRLQECGLAMHPDKTKIVYCKDDYRKGKYHQQSFDFLGYTFRPRRSKSKAGKFFINFSPAMSNQAGKKIRQVIRSWNLQLRSDKSLVDLAYMFRSKIQGWINYYGRFYKSAMHFTLGYLNQKLSLWIMRKFKLLRDHRRRADHRLGKIAAKHPNLFPHWRLGLRPATGARGAV